MPRLRDHIGDKVTYRPPLSAQKQGALNRIGEIIDEVWAIDSQRDPPKHEHNDPHGWGDYEFCSQLIEWQEGGHSRRGIFSSCGRNSCGALEVGNQRTTAPARRDSEGLRDTRKHCAQQHHSSTPWRTAEGVLWFY
jgi:hypothetical protein